MLKNRGARDWFNGLKIDDGTSLNPGDSSSSRFPLKRI